MVKRYLPLLPVVVICVGGLVVAVAGQTSNAARAGMLGLAVGTATVVFLARDRLHGSGDFRPSGGLLVLGTLLGMGVYWMLDSVPDIGWHLFFTMSGGGVLAYMVTSPRLRD